MRILRPNSVFAVTAAALAATLVHAAAPPPPPPPKPAPPPVQPSPPSQPGPTGGTFPDASGQFQSLTVTSTGAAANPFFEALGTNGRTCATCHVQAYGWTITPTSVQALFDQTNGQAPLFNTVDGSDSPDDVTTTLADRQQAYSMLLNKALIRVGLPLSTSAQFTLSAVDDPYNFASPTELSLFRRPLPATNLPFLSTVMWDGRETLAGETLTSDLDAQDVSAILTHEQAASAPSAGVIAQIVAFETSSATAQISTNLAGSLTANGALGGPSNLIKQPFYLGINDPFGGNPTGAPFNPDAFTLYNSWGVAANSPSAAQQSIARGQAIFDTRQFTVMNVAGLNDTLGKTAVIATCTTCHDTPNVGNHSVEDFFDLSLTDAAVRTPDLPLYTLTNKTTGAVRQTTDPGRALITGEWADIGKFKAPILRGLATRAPYFHNGFAPTIPAVVAFYNKRFNIGLTQQDQTDLAAYLSSL